MNQAELTEYNLGRSLDNLVNIDGRGYGVCNILYEAAYKKSGGPVTMKAARALLDTLKEGDAVFIFTGFILKDFNMAETDGPPGAAALARALIAARGVKPVFVIPAEVKPALKALAGIMGFHLLDDLAAVKKTPLSAGFVEFTKDSTAAVSEAAGVIAAAGKAGLPPKYAIAVECSGANEKGVYHNSTGKDISGLQAKSDVLFDALCRACPATGSGRAGVPSLAIGDLGNECGMGTLAPHIAKFIPRAAAGSCECGCGGGILAATSAATVLTATVSNWGAYGLCAALAFLSKKPEALHTAELERRALTAASEAGLIDMYGWQIPAVDGTNLAKNTALVTLMEECVLSSFELKEICKPWFDKVIERGYFGQAANAKK